MRLLLSAHDRAICQRHELEQRLDNELPSPTRIAGYFQTPTISGTRESENKTPSAWLAIRRSRSKTIATLRIEYAGDQGGGRLIVQVGLLHQNFTLIKDDDVPPTGMMRYAGEQISFRFPNKFGVEVNTH